MAKDKNSFLMYSDFQGTFEMLPDELAGKLIKIIFQYVNDQNPDIEDLTLKIAFEPIKMALKRDLKKYERIKEVRSAAGKKSATKRNKTNKKEQKSTKSTVSVNDSVSVNVSVNDKVSLFLNWFNEEKLKISGVKGKFRTLTKTDEKNLKKLRTNYQDSDFVTAFKNMMKSKWAIENNMTTPSHFLRVENFNKYLNQGGSEIIRITHQTPSN